MKQVHANYTFDASTKTITLTGLNIAQDQLLLVTNATRGVIYYNFASSSHRATVTAGANTTVVLTDASTTGHADSDQLTIHYDDQASTQTIAGTVTANGGNFAYEYDEDTGDFGDKGVLIGWTVDSSGAFKPASDVNPLPISGTVTVGNSVTIGSLPAISGTVTANLSSTNLNSVTIGVRGAVTASLTNANLISSELLIPNNSNYTNSAVPVGFYDGQVGGEFKVANNTDWPLPVAIQLNGNYQDSVFSGNPLPISGTVTARLQDASGTDLTSTTIGGTPRLNVTLSSAASVGSTAPTFASLIGGQNVWSGALQALKTNNYGAVYAAVDGSVGIANSGGLIASSNPLQVTLAQTGSNSTAIRVDGSAVTQPVRLESLPASTVTVSSLPAISGTVTANTVINDSNFYDALANYANNYNVPWEVAGNVGVSGTVTVGNTVTASTQFEQEIGIDAQPNNGVQLGFYSESGTAYRGVSEVNGLPISGTVTANVNFSSTNSTSPTGAANIGFTNAGGDFVQASTDFPFPVLVRSIDLAAGASLVPISGTVTVGNTVTIAGTVTANVSTKSWIDISSITQNTQFIAVGGFDGASNQIAPIPLTDGASGIYVAQDTNNTPSWNVSVGGMPRGVLTTRFGSVTTANTAQLTSAVTNTSRKYLLIQNVTTSSNVITVGIGFTPTTTQGIQLTAGAGITFESSYIPTGAVYVLSSVTASNFTILEA